jgi:hypothetical protein
MEPVSCGAGARWVIFAGRFQPLHLGHMHTMNSFASRMVARDVLVLAAVVSDGLMSGAVVDDEFRQTSEEHHVPERNPWPLPTRLRALGLAAQDLRSRYVIKACVTALPRPDLAWEVIRAWFPGERMWLIPSAGERFDDAKAEFFAKRGDAVVRVRDETGVSGRELREYYRTGQLQRLRMYLPECVRETYLERE